MEKKHSGGLVRTCGLALVNILFFLTLFLQNSMYSICAHTVWALVLIQLGKRAEARWLRTLCALLGLYAMLVVGVQTFLLFTQ